MLLLAACGQDAAPDAAPAAPRGAQAKAEPDERILCARGQDALTRACTVDQTPGEGGLVLTVRQPDGAFHRLLVTNDARGVIAADGAEPARVTIVEPSQIEVAIGDARYRLPAAVQPPR